jgi:hypothetical protein
MNKLKTFVIAAGCLGWIACITDDNKQAQVPLAPGQTTSAEVEDATKLTTVQWLDSVVNSGTILEGQKLEVSFRFKNTGDKPLVIESAQPSCGCTVPVKPEEPVMPGKEGLIKAVFNSEGRTGTNHKTITVRANTKPSGSHILEFNVTVLGKTDGPKAATSTPQQF